MIDGKVAGAAWVDWLKSDDGRGCVQYGTLPHNRAKAQQFLENRLWSAYMAGISFAERELKTKADQGAVRDGSRVFLDRGDLDRWIAKRKGIADVPVRTERETVKT